MSVTAVACRDCGGVAVYSTKLCKPCNAAYARSWRAKQSAEWHDRERAKWRAQMVTKRRIWREYIDSKKDAPCADCGRKYPPYVMQFDHVRGRKEFSISEYGGRNWRLEKIEAEIAKCDLVCANCHMERTHGKKG